jgi:pimeloyl-ACP methyl ester carboxylesterase
MCALSAREAGVPGAPAVLLLHGFPESSFMWRDVLDVLAARGLHALAPDLAGFGDSPADRPGTWAHQVELVESFRAERGLADVAVVCHDWGGMIGLRWACDHPDRVRAIVASSTGFFPDGKWHGMADALRTPEQGEQLVDSLTSEGFTALLGQLSGGIGPETAAEYFKAFGDADRRAAVLELYRSGDFESELAPYEGKLAALGVPALMLWGEDDAFTPLAGAHRLAAEMPGARVHVIPGTGHFVVDDAPAVYAAAVAEFLGV